MLIWQQVSAMTGSACSDYTKEILEKWSRLSPQWFQSFPVCKDKEQLGSWIEVDEEALKTMKSLRLRCKVCHAAKSPCSSWADFTTKKTPNAIQYGNFLRHARRKPHLDAVDSCLQGLGGLAAAIGVVIIVAVVVVAVIVAVVD